MLIPPPILDRYLKNLEDSRARGAGVRVWAQTKAILSEVFDIFTFNGALIIE